MATIKNVLLTKKIAGTLYRIYPKTSAEQVVYDETQSVAEKLAALTTALSSTMTNEGVQDLIDASTEALYNKIMGLTDSQTTISEAYDTLKEVADYLTEHEDVVSGFTSDISDLKSAVSTLQDAIDAMDYSKVTASTTNGNIVVDGQEVTVYTLPALTTDDVAATDDKQYVTAAEKEIIANAGTATIEATTSEPDDSSAADNTLYIVYEE